MRQSFVGDVDHAVSRLSQIRIQHDPNNPQNHPSRPEAAKLRRYSYRSSDDLGESKSCGWGHCTPACCQRFSNANWFCLVITLCGVVQGMAINGFINGAISTLERRFELTSTEAGLIASCYDIMFVLLVIPISYFGGQGDKPKYIASGMVILGIGSFVFSLPHFIADEYKVEAAEEVLCVRQEVNKGNISTHSNTVCKSDAPSPLNFFKYFFFAGQLLHGAGATALYTLGVTYLDENVSQRASSFYNGIFYTGGVIGPACGFIMVSEFLKIFTNPLENVAKLGLTTENPKWIGGWWIGFLVSGTFAVVLALPLFAFPASLPGSNKYACERGAEAHETALEDDIEQPTGVKDICLSIRLLLCNVPFMLLNFAAAADGVLFTGFSTFMPKFIEYHYGKAAGPAALYVGIAAVPTGGGATFFTGYLIQKYNLKVRGILRLCVFLSTSLCVMPLMFLMDCNDIPYAGITRAYGTLQGQRDVELKGKQLDNTCNKDCNCAEQDYFPMCGRDETLYFSPCYAGCTQVMYDGGIKLYSDCSCVTYNLTAEDTKSNDVHLGIFGKCNSKCDAFLIFMIVLSFTMVLLFGVSMPALTATLRCVPNRQRSFGLGLQWIIARCLGTIPGPIIFGAMFDRACLLWQPRCDGTGSCFFYDNPQVGIYLTSLAITFSAIGAAAFWLALICYRPPNRLSDSTNVTLSVGNLSGMGISAAALSARGHSGEALSARGRSTEALSAGRLSGGAVPARASLQGTANQK